MDISLKKLNYLVTVAETQSFTRAAELLHLSQPALSKTISAVEETYGVRLFDRSRSGVSVTTVGADIIADAKRLLRHARSFDHNSQVLAGGKRGRVSWGIGPTVAGLALPQLASSILGNGSGVIINTEIRPFHVLISLLNSDEIEFLIAENTFSPIHPEIEHQKIGSTEGVFFVRNGHPLLQQETIVPGDILSYPVACQEEPVSLLKRKPDLNVLVCDNHSLMQEVALSSDAICIFPEQFSKLHTQNKMKRLLIHGWKPRATPIIAGWVRGRRLSPIARQIVESIRTLFANME